MAYTLDQIRGVVPEHRVLQHPFLLAFKEGKLNRSQVAHWLGQQYYFLTSLPNAFAVLYGRIPDSEWDIKRKILAIIDIESWGSEKQAAHSNTFRDVADYLGVDVEHLKRSEPRPYTREYLEFRFHTCLDHRRSLGEGLAAIALGNEVLNLYIYQAYKEGLEKMPDMVGVPMQYFDVHLHDEESDFRVFADVFASVVQSHEEMEKAKNTLNELLDRRVIFFDGLANDIGIVNGAR